MDRFKPSNKIIFFFLQNIQRIFVFLKNIEYIAFFKQHKNIIF
jgi:hypothetical protein